VQDDGAVLIGGKREVSGVEGEGRSDPFSLLSICP
jgi:hypothetical protein